MHHLNVNVQVNRNASSYLAAQSYDVDISIFKMLALITHNQHGQAYSIKVKDQGCLKMTCCTTLCGKELLYNFERLALIQDENLQKQLFQVTCSRSNVMDA